jgi:hypothetical protein
MPQGCAPCPFPPFPRLPGPCPPRMVVPTYRVPGPFCCEPAFPGPGYCDVSGTSGISYTSGLSGTPGEMHYGMHPGWHKHPCPMPKKKHIEYHHPAPWMARKKRETEIELGGGVEIEKPNPLGNWMGYMGQWLGKDDGATGGMGGGKWGNWLGKGPGDQTGGGKMGNWLGKQPGADQTGEMDDDGSGKKLWPK